MALRRSMIQLGVAAFASTPLSFAHGDGSELPDGSVVITALPFVGFGDTSDNLDDFDAVCPWASDAPDVFYAFTVPDDVAALSIHMCESHYDTKLFVLDDAFNEIACNDDWCSDFGGGNSFASALPCVPVQPGETIHIAIDGWSGASGVYEMQIETCLSGIPCIFGEPFTPHCPDGAIDEAEPCLENADDVTNGGCNWTPARFTPITCGATICGTLYQTAEMRDTDWFELTTDDPMTVTMTAVGESRIQFGRIDDRACVPGAPSCSCITGGLDPSAWEFPCREGRVDADVAAGRSWWFMSTIQTGAVPCSGDEPGSAYVLTLSCAEPSCCASGDADQNGVIDLNDIVRLLAHWGNCSAPPCCDLGDANGDQTIDFNDLIIMLGHWGACAL